MRKFLQMCGLVVLAVVMLGADSSTTRLDRIGHKLVCQCGCGQILMECNHVGCPVSPVMIGELRSKLDAGVTEKQALDFFIDKYGPVALAAPIRGGFDNVAWITPFAVVAIAILVVFFLARYWSKRRQIAVAANAPVTQQPAGSVEERIRRETDYDQWGDGR